MKARWAEKTPLQPVQQTIEFADQGGDFPRQFSRSPSGANVRASRRWTSAATYRSGSRPRRTIHATAPIMIGSSRSERDDDPLRRGARQRFADLHRLRDLNHPVRRLQAIGPPGLPAQVEIGVP